jgi:hypothetical protein
MSNKSKAMAVAEDIGREFKTWWSFVAACGGDYLSTDSSKLNRDYRPEKPEASSLEYAKISFH